jgi:glycosyltransferase involved in cell wall biosynthesis
VGVTPTAVHQFVPSLAPRDAIGSHTLQIRKLLRDMGIASEIYVREVTSDLRRTVRPYRKYTPGRAGGREWLLYQASTGSPVAEFLLARPEPKLVNYHNITPGSYFVGWEPHVAAELSLGRRQLADLAGVTELAVADSAFNERELLDTGYRRTTVVPILLDESVFHDTVDETALKRLERAKREGGARWLFVGRVSPHKAQHEVIQALAVYRRVYDPKARLTIVGSAASSAYSSALERFAAELGLADAVDLVGSVPDGVLAAHYRTTDVFVCCSHHEGFCVPLLEAMHHDVPVVAVAAAAVPETLGGGGVLVERSASHVAAAVHRVVEDAATRAAVIAAGRRRLDELSFSASRRRMREALELVLAA